MANSSNKWIGDKLYSRIVSVMPIPCVDLILINKGRFLLGKRINEPAKGEWFFPGGRVFKGETLKRAAARIAREEVGLNIPENKFKFLTTDQTIFTGRDSQKNRHSINSIFTAEINRSFPILPGYKQHSEFEWFDSIKSAWHPYLKSALKKLNY